MNKSQTISVIAISIFAAILLVGPVADDANAHNKKQKESSKNKDDKKEKKQYPKDQKEKKEKKQYPKDQKEAENKNNVADQSISQTQFSEQFSECISGGVMTLSCNNVDLQAAATVGNNALSQK